jgi:predicted transport protein
MGQHKLFRINQDVVQEVPSSISRLERHLQGLIERNLSELFGIRFLASEYRIEADPTGRIDTLGIDENDCPVIIEYKRQGNQNILSQILFYRDWLMKNKAAFELLVLRKLGTEDSAKIDFGKTRLLCIASEYSKYDLSVVDQLKRNIELITYRHYGNDLLLLEYAKRPQALAKTKPSEEIASFNEETVAESEQIGFLQRYARADQALLNLLANVRDHILALGEDVEIAELKHYQAFKRIKNFACVDLAPSKGCIMLYLRVDPSTVTLEPGFTRDMRELGHLGTGDLEVLVRSQSDIERADTYLRNAYDSV